MPIYMAPLKLVNPKIDVSLNRKFLTAASSETCVNCWMWGSPSIGDEAAE
ncbi:MAG TPA: hypothetical protein VIJ90_11300 [Gemmatimonadaceae bacterium]